MTTSISGQTTLANTSTAASSAPSKDGATIAGNFTQFLTLLTTQLKNQNPLDPMDTNQFTQQLVQFAGVEQQLKTNDQLGTIMTNAKASAAGSASNLVGKSVTADGATTDLTDGSANWVLTPDRAAAKAVITIKDATGNAVATKSTTLTAGAQSFKWDGTSSSGFSSADGKYTITVDATDATGSKVIVATRVTGTVDGVDLSGSEPILEIGDARVALSSVKSLSGALQ